MKLTPIRAVVRRVLPAATSAAALLFLAAPSFAVDAPAKRPNILIILADDQGYGDLGFQGGEDIPTPNIDSLAKNGVRFTSGYVSGPYCSPTRAGLLTGRYQQRFGHEFNPGATGESNATFGLSLAETTLADRLKSAGYTTALVGKWHLGFAPPFHPQKRGFDEFFGFLGGAHTYVDYRADSPQAIYRGTEPVKENPERYLTDAFGDEASAFIGRQKGKDNPFFLYLAFNAVHGPLESTKKYLDRFPDIKDEKRKTYAAMTSALDDAVGRVLESLRASGQEENTLIFYFSDNGGPPVNASSNGPLRGYKAQTLEGGIRIPFVAQWKGKLPAGATYDKPVIQLDIHATALAASGTALAKDAKPLDGVDLLPFVSGTSSATATPHENLYWRFGDQWAIRQGDWKLVRHRQSTAAELYDLSKDIGEANDLAAKEPEKVKALTAAYATWNAQLVEPTWIPGPAKNNTLGGGKAGGKKAAKGAAAPGNVN